MLEATFGNPHEDEDGTFDFGIEFRINGDYINPRRMYLVVDDAGSWMAAVGTDDQWSDATEFPLDDGRFRRLNDEPREEDQLTMVVTEPSCISPSTGNTLPGWVYVKPAQVDWPSEPASILTMLWTTPIPR